MMKRLWLQRGCFVMALGAWLLLFLLALELTAFVWQAGVERWNPLVRAYREGTPFPEPEGKVVPGPFLPSNAEVLGGWDVPPLPLAGDDDVSTVLDWGVLRGGAEQGMRQQQRAQFSALSPLAREVYARMRRELIITLDSRRRIRAVYGTDKALFQGAHLPVTRMLLKRAGIPAVVYSAIDKARETKTPQCFQLYWPNAAMPQAILSATVMDAEEGGDHHVFVSLHPDEIESPQPTPVTSRWDAPFFRYRANYQDREEAFTTNSLGFRGAEILTPKPAGVFRVICIGGSTTQEGACDECAFPALLERCLRSTLSTNAIEVINAGTPGIAAALHLLRLPEYLEVEPDMAIIHLGVNDVLNINNRWYANMPASWSRAVRNFMPPLFMPTLHRFERAYRRDRELTLELMIHLFQREGVAVALAPIAFPDPNLISAAERRYFEYQGKYSWNFPAFSLNRYVACMRVNNAMLRDLADRHNTLLLPVDARITGGIDVFTDFCHMTRAGIEAKAAILCESLADTVAARMHMPHGF